MLARLASDRVISLSNMAWACRRSPGSTGWLTISTKLRIHDASGFGDIVGIAAIIDGVKGARLIGTDLHRHKINQAGFLPQVLI